MFNKNILAFALMTLSGASFAAAPVADLAPDGAKIVFNREWIKDDIHRNPAFTDIKQYFSSDKQAGEFVSRYVDKKEIPLAFSYCKNTVGLQHAAFISQSSYTIIKKDTRAVLAPLSPCILVAATFPPFDTCLVMHLHFQNKLEEAVQTVTEFVPADKRAQAKVMLFTHKFDALAVIDQKFAPSFNDFSGKNIDQKEAIKSIKDALEKNGFTRLHISPARIDAGADWSRVLICAGSVYPNAQKSVVVSYTTDKNEWQIETVCLFTEYFLKRSKTFPNVTPNEYHKYAIWHNQFIKNTTVRDYQEEAFLALNLYPQIAQKPVRILKDFLK